MDAIRELDIDVVIPAHNERETIALCLASLMRQTIKPSSVTVIDDGSDDDTADLAEAFAAANHFAIQVIRRRRPIGKTPSLKIQSRVLEGDVEFILDADTVLISPDLIEKLVAQLYRVPGIASACAAIFPLRDVDRRAMLELDTIQRLLEERPDIDLAPHRSLLSRILLSISQFYEDAIFQYLCIFLYSGLQNVFGSLPGVIGSTVAYRRDYLKEMFDRYEPGMGDNLTVTEDLFIGTAFLAQGYHNSLCLDVFARTEVPEVQHVPRQRVRWGSGWLQSAYFLPDIIKSPFKAVRRLRHKRANADAAQQRRVVDGYRQPFGLRFASELGRPTGWLMFGAIFERLSFLLILLMMALFREWLPLALTILGESLLFTSILAVFSKTRRLEYTVKGLLAPPYRYAMMALEVYIFTRFLVELLTRQQRRWRM